MASLLPWQPNQSKSETASESSSDSDAADDSSSDSSTSSSSENSWEKKYRRQRQTAKARAASIRSRGMKKLAKNALLNPPAHPAERFKDDLEATSQIHKAGQGHSTVRLRRLRLLASYVKAWCAAILAFFQRLVGRVQHTIVIAIVDDTNIRMSEIPAGANNWRMSRVVTVMNTIQKLVVNYKVDGQDGASASDMKMFNVITPTVSLSKADTDTLSAYLLSNLFCFLGVISMRYKDLLPDRVLSDVPIQGSVVTLDSLKANVAMLKQFRESLHTHHKQSDVLDTIYPLLGIFCLLHQLALARGPILFGFQNFWSSVVRLAHLFENSSFRTQFRLAMLKILCENFTCVPVTEMPPGFTKWKEDRISVFQFTPGASTSKMRVQFHRNLMKWDNGNGASNSLTHYCVGHCCKGESQSAKQWFALLQLTKYYVLLFSFGFPVPLTYRWVHAGRAIQYVKDRAWGHFVTICPVDSR